MGLDEIAGTFSNNTFTIDENGIGFGNFAG